MEDWKGSIADEFKTGKLGEKSTVIVSKAIRNLRSCKNGLTKAKSKRWKEGRLRLPG